MKYLLRNRRTLALIAVLVPLLALFAYTALRSGPLAPIPVTTTVVTAQAITPALFGIGTVESRYTFRIGPTLAGRIKSVAVQVGDRVRAGQQLGEMEPVDLDERRAALDAGLKRAQAEARAAQALLAEAQARERFAEAQAGRYDQLFAEKVVSAEVVEARRQELETAAAGRRGAQDRLVAAGQETARWMAERDGLIQQRDNLRLVAPVDGLVTVRDADPGTTVVAGQAVVEMIDPAGVVDQCAFRPIGRRRPAAGLAGPYRVALPGGES